MLTGNLTDACHPQHRHRQFPAILRQVACAYTRRQLHVVADDYATHKYPAVPTSSAIRGCRCIYSASKPWLNLAETFFSIISQALHRRSFLTVADLIAAIKRFIDAWNGRCAPFTWTKDPDTVIAKATDPQKRKARTTSVTEH